MRMEDMKENLKMINLKEREYFIIAMDHGRVINMLENGKKA